MCFGVFLCFLKVFGDFGRDKVRSGGRDGADGGFGCFFVAFDRFGGFWMASGRFPQKKETYFLKTNVFYRKCLEP